MKLWSIDGRLLKTLTGHKGMIDNVIFSPDGQIIASLGGSELKLWSRDGILLKTMNHSAGDVDDRTVILWNLDSVGAGNNF